MIKVYYAKVFPHMEENTFFAHLNKIEKKRRQKILAGTNEKARLRSLTAGSLLHDVLCRELGLFGENQPAFEFAYEKEGKPYLVRYPKLHFNLSHSGDYVCCAVGSTPVGTDIQKITKVKEGLARRFFTDKDNQNLASCSGEDREKLFFRMWSIKESYMKLTGRGMAEGLNTFEIDWQRNLILEKSTDMSEAVAYFQEYGSLSQYCFCVCTKVKPQKVVWRESSLSGITFLTDI